MHSKQWHYSLHRDFQNCYSTRRSPTGFFSSNSTRVPIHPHLHVHITLQYIQRILHPEIQFYIQKTESSSSTTTTFQRAKRPSIQKRNSTHRRQGDLLEIHPCVLQDIPGIQPQDLPKASSYYRHSSLSRHSRHSSPSRHSSHSRHSRDIPDIPVIHDLPAFPGNSTNSTMFQYLQGIHPIPAFSDENAYSTVRLVSTENSTEYQLGNYKYYKHSFFKEREML